MSAYTSIKDVSRSLLGKFSFLLTPIVYERFRNIDFIKEVKCPVFFLHGKLDNLIPSSHSQELKRHCQTINHLHEPPGMDHNFFDFDKDLIYPALEFFNTIEEALKADK